jgi:hypothetical protein
MKKFVVKEFLLTPTSLTVPAPPFSKQLWGRPREDEPPSAGRSNFDAISSLSYLPCTAFVEAILECRV